MSQPSSTTKLAVPRHLQDYNGYCGPACAMMVISSEAPASLPAQQALFRDIREHAKQANDRRPIKSPAESLLALLSKNSRARWRKVFDPVPDKVAALLVHAVENIGQPCLLLVSKGMHWVVAFGITQRDDGSVAGVLMRDPAWAGMPAFYGLSVFPEKSTFTHCAEPCTCLQSDNPPGSVHERYMAMEELVSPRGLQGTPDWEGKGAIAIVPEEVRAAAVLPPPSATQPAAPGLTPQAAAMIAVREHGLVGRRDSPPDWRRALEGGQPGTPILVKDPDDPRDDFYLVPVYAPGASRGDAEEDVRGHEAPDSGQQNSSRRTAWIMLDTVTLRMREASLLDHWMVPAFPTDQDANSIAGEDVTLPDGTRHRFKKSDLRPNHRNLVWKASAASILPYWPLREFVAPHPVTGEPTSIFVTQHGKIYPALLPDEVPAAQSPPSSPPAQNSPAQSGPKAGGIPWKSLLGAGAAAAGITVAAVKFLAEKPPAAPPSPSGVQVTDIGAGKASLPSDAVEFKTASIPPNTELPVVQRRLEVLSDSLKLSYSKAENVMKSGELLPPELEQLNAAVAALEEAPAREASLTGEELDELRDYLKNAQAYGDEVNAIKTPHPAEEDAPLTAFKRAAAEMSAQAGPILRALSARPGPDFKPSIQALMNAAVSLADTVPGHKTAHTGFLEFIRTIEADAAKLTAEAVALGLDADFFSGKKALTPDENAKLSDLANRAFRLAHKAKKERDEHAGRAYRPPASDLFSPPDRSKSANYNDSSERAPDPEKLLADLIGAEQVAGLFKEGAAFREAGADRAAPQKARAFLEKIARLLFDLSHEKAEHESALKLLATLEQKVLDLKGTKGIARLIGSMQPAADPALPGRIADLREKVKDFQARLGNQQSGHSTVLSALEGDVAELGVLKARYDAILKTLPAAGSQRNSGDQKIIAELDAEFPRLATSTSSRRESQNRALKTLPPLNNGAASLLQRLEALLSKLPGKPTAPAKPPAPPVRSSKPKPARAK